LPGLLLLEYRPPSCKFYRHSFCGPAHWQHIAFLVSIEKETERRKQKIKELHHPQSKNVRQKNLPKAKLHNVALYNSSKGKAVLRNAP